VEYIFLDTAEKRHLYFLPSKEQFSPLYTSEKVSILIILLFPQSQPRKDNRGCKEEAYREEACVYSRVFATGGQSL